MARRKAEHRRRLPKTLQESEMTDIAQALKRLDLNLHGTYISYGPAKSYVNKLERLGRELKVSPAQLMIDKRNGHIMAGRKALAALQLKTGVSVKQRAGIVAAAA